MCEMKAVRKDKVITVFLLTSAATLFFSELLRHSAYLEGGFYWRAALIFLLTGPI